jgi:glycosyltransferase involved in cell wall biosynthesis
LTRPVRVGIDVTPMLPKATGVDTYIRGLVTHISRLASGHDITLFTNLEDRVHFHRLIDRSVRLVSLSARPRPARLAFQQALLPVACRLLNLDVVHSPAFLMPYVRGPQRHLLTVHDMTFFSLAASHTALHRSGTFRRAVLASIYRADQVNVPSEWTRRNVLSTVPHLPAERVRVVAPGIDDAFSPRPEREISALRSRLGLTQRYILHVGTLEPRKNLDRLLEAYRLLVAGGEKVGDLVLAGRYGWGSKALRNRVADLPRRVHLLGYVAQGDLPALYSGARVFVYPSLQEGFGFPPLEAMACGVPTIASRSSALGENLAGAAELVSPYNVGAMAAAMSRLSADEGIRTRLRREGLMRAASFAWEDTARKTLACYDELATRSRSTSR